MDGVLNKLSDRFLEALKALKISGYRLSKEIPEITQSTLTHIRKGRNEPSKKVIDLLLSKYTELNPAWLLTGEGEMLKKQKEEKQTIPFDDMENEPKNKKLIPFYDDAASAGEVNKMAAKLEKVSKPVEWIDPSDWFKDATAAIRHYGNSMVEYPSGCVLALKEVKDKQLIIWGNEYVIETDEYRIIKRIQRGESHEHIKAYSSNPETYPDGKLIYEPLDVCWADIKKIFLVLGYMVKKGGRT